MGHCRNAAFYWYNSGWTRKDRRTKLRLAGRPPDSSVRQDKKRLIKKRPAPDAPGSNSPGSRDTHTALAQDAGADDHYARDVPFLQVPPVIFPQIPSIRRQALLCLACASHYHPNPSRNPGRSRSACSLLANTACQNDKLSGRAYLLRHVVKR